MIEIIGEIRDATPEEMERFESLQRERNAVREAKRQKKRLKIQQEKKLHK
ncbi:MAG: hypothetical protein Q4C77_03685 [Eubacteriales bacterium]|nr:hypothetical protein [Eubacteriales bacterium]